MFMLRLHIYLLDFAVKLYEVSQWYFCFENTQLFDQSIFRYIFRTKNFSATIFFWKFSDQRNVPENVHVRCKRGYALRLHSTAAISRRTTKPNTVLLRARLYSTHIKDSKQIFRPENLFKKIFERKIFWLNFFVEKFIQK